MSEYLPKWRRELEIFMKMKSVLILEGNLLDQYRYPQDGDIPAGSVVPLPQYLHSFFTDAGYEAIAFYDTIRGFRNPFNARRMDSFDRLLPSSASGRKIDFKGRGETAPALISHAVGQNRVPVVVILDYASRYLSSPANMEQAEIDSFTILIQASLEAKDVRTPQGSLKNLIVLLANKVNDLPPWFYLDNPNVKSIFLSTPEREEREALVKGEENFRSFFASDIYAEESAYYETHSEELEAIRNRFVGITEGFRFSELNGLRRLAKSQRIHIRNLCDAVSLYKFGIQENPWNKLDADRIRNANFQRRVKGQDAAVTKTLDVVKRAITGLSGVRSSSSSRPKGALFFAGPTGTGKTETAKTLAETLFGDERNCIRFDMSEYGQPHSDQKLLGAPPGYVGYESGGQLTNAVRNHPFSILLFDEIEKAHPSILDKFLQILEDGRMTDGQGNTAYFSECVIIFTSNLGIYATDSTGGRVLRVRPDMPYEAVCQSVRKGVEDYFKSQLGRPELLNRIGENIVVFDFIRESAAEEILQSQIARIVRSLSAEKGLELSFSEEAIRTLRQRAFANLENGGRGIGNIVESALVNPLSRYLFDHEVSANQSVRIEEIQEDGMSYSLRCTLS